MTVNEIIARFDEERINTESLDNKIKWLREIEQIILDDVVLTHVNAIEEPETYFDNFNAFSELIVPLQYADVYIEYMDMKLNLKMNQLKKYNNASTLFNTVYMTYQQWYNRNNKPLTKKEWFSHEVL